MVLTTHATSVFAYQNKHTTWQAILIKKFTTVSVCCLSIGLERSASAPGKDWLRPNTCMDIKQKKQKQHHKKANNKQNLIKRFSKSIAFNSGTFTLAGKTKLLRQWRLELLSLWTKSVFFLTALIAPVAVLNRFTSWPESTDNPLLTADEVELAPSPPALGSISESGWNISNMHVKKAFNSITVQSLPVYLEFLPAGL